MTRSRPSLPVLTPLPSMNEGGAFKLQQRLVAASCQYLPGDALFTADAGVVPGLGRPRTTAAVEQVIADAWSADGACLVQGAGTGAIRAALSAGPWSEERRQLLVHDAPDYSTTGTTFRDGCVETVRADFDVPGAVEATLHTSNRPSWGYVQHTRQRLADSFNPMAVVQELSGAGVRVIVDDNYAVMRTPSIGVENGAAASVFSAFKLHGPEGVGVVVGDADIVDRARQHNYSGGGQVQGWQALDVLQALVAAPANWVWQSREVMRLADALRNGAVPAIVDAGLTNAQDLCVVALLAEPNADQVRERAASAGAAPYPVGSNSRYEIAPLVYRLSSSTLEAAPQLRPWTLRINPMRAGADLTIDILRRATGV